MRTEWLLAPLLFTACGGTGSASVTGNFGALGLELHTVFAWIDATEQKMDNGKLVFAPRDKTRLNVVLSGAKYDPSRDQRFVPVAELVELGREAQRKGSATIAVRNYHVFTAGGQLAIPATGDGDAPRLDITLVPGLTELSADATYPANAPRLGSKVTATLTLTEAGRAAGEAVAGKLDVTVAAADGETDVVGGNVIIDLDAPLISERVAECNNSSQLTDQECEPGFGVVDGD